MIAIGIGCRRLTPAASIEVLVRQALALAPASVRPGLFSIEDKADEQGLIEAAASLDLPLTFLSRDALRAQASGVQTRSGRAEDRFGVPSVAEAAALAGAGPNASLIVPRITGLGVTCAVAAS